MRLVAALICLLATAGMALAQNPVVPTPPVGDNSHRIANTEWVNGAIGTSQTFPVVGAAGNGTTDDTVPFQTALAACAAAGGGTVTFGPHQYAIKSGSLAVPYGCVLSGPGTPQGISASGGAYSTSIPALLVNPSYTIDGQGAVQNLVELNPAVIGQSTGTLAGSLAYNAAFSGTAITIDGYFASVNNVFIVGYATCIADNGFDFPKIERAFGDCAALSGQAALSTTSVRGIGRFHNVLMRPFFPIGAVTSASASVTGAADNGSGAIRISFAGAPPSAWAVGNTVYVFNVGGFTGTNGAWPIAAIGSNYIDLSGSASAPATLTGSWAVNSEKIAMSSLGSLGEGQNVCPTTCAGIPAGATITKIDWAAGNIYISGPTTAAESGETLNFTNPSYTTGGTAEVTANYNLGTAFLSSSDNAIQYEMAGAFGFQHCLHMTAATSGDWFTDSWCDGESLHDGGSIGIEDDSTGLSTNRVTSVSLGTMLAPVYKHGSTSLVMNGLTIFDGAPGMVTISKSAGTLLVGNSIEEVASAVSYVSPFAGQVAIADNGTVSALTFAGDQFGNDAVVTDAIGTAAQMPVDQGTQLYDFLRPNGSPDADLLFNGNFTLDQPKEGGNYTTSAPMMDGWRAQLTATGWGITVARATPAGLPAGASDEMLETVTSAASPGSADIDILEQRVANISSLGWGTTTPHPVTLSFWRKCSVAGTYGVSLSNGSTNTADYTIAYQLAAGTWTPEVFAIPGPTIGSWAATDYQLSVALWDAAGSSRQTSTLNAWQAAAISAPTGLAQLVATNGATCETANVRLDAGAFGYVYAARPAAANLLLAQRYYRKTFPQGTARAQDAGFAGAVCAATPNTGAGTFGAFWSFIPPMAATPSITTYNPGAANANWRDPTASSDLAVDVDPASAIGDAGVFIGEQTTAPTANHTVCIQATADARL